jgi:hypothetical protein
MGAGNIAGGFLGRGGEGAVHPVCAVLAAFLTLPAVATAGSSSTDEVLPVLTVSLLLPDNPRLSAPLQVGKAVHLVLEDLPAGMSFLVMETHTGAVLATGKADGRGIAEIHPFLPLAPGELTIAADTGEWERRVPVDLIYPQDVERPPLEEVVALIPPVPGDDCPCPSASVSYLYSKPYNYGHWTGTALWYRVENDRDPDNRYYISVTRWIGRGTTADYPRHETTDIYHSAAGYVLDGNTFISDMDPVLVPYFSSSGSFSVGTAPGAAYEWTQENPATINGRIQPDADGTWDYETFASQATFRPEWRSYSGKLEWAAQGTVPTGHYGNMWVKMVHRSYACQICGKLYTDDTGWYARPIDWW